MDGEGGLDSGSVLALLDSDLVAFGVQSAAGSDEGEHTLHGDAEGGEGEVKGRGRGRGGEGEGEGVRVRTTPGTNF